jgi:hypothetical protein
MKTNKILRFSDIQTSEVLFYDEAVKDRCFKICTERNIDCLPVLEEPRTLYYRDEVLQKFRPENLSENGRVSADANLFDAQVLEKYRLQPLLLVYQGNELSGVAHYTDYNKPLVSATLLEILFEYEKSLRALLIRSGYKNVDMIAYFSDRKTKERTPELFERKVNEYFKYGSQKKLPQFEVFYMADLTALINHKRILKLNDKTKLRNMLVHANEFVNLDEPGTENFIYDFETFETFFRWVQELRLDMKRVANRLVFSQ